MEIMDATRIRRLRRRLKMSQPQFAAALGVGLTTLRHWEQDVRPALGAADTLLRIVAAKPEVLGLVSRQKAGR